MTQSIPSTTSKEDISLIPFVCFKTPEELISFAKDEWLEQLYQIPEEKRGSYRAGIERVVQELQNKCTLLANQGWSSQASISELKEIIHQYNTSYALFDEHKATYAEQKLVEENQNLTLGEKFRKAGRSFQVYHLPEQTPQDPHIAQAQWEALEVLGGMHTIGTALQLTGATVAEGAKQLCKLTKTTETACKATLDFGKAVIHATKIDDAIQYVQTHGGASLAQVLEEHYGFPKDQAEQLAHQHVDDLLATATAGGTGVASHLVLKHLFKPAPLSEAVVTAAAEQPAATGARFTMGNFALDKGYIIETQNYTVGIGKTPEISPSASGQQPLPTTPFTTEISHSTALGAKAPLTAKTGQELLQLGEANATSKTFTRLKEYLTSRDTEFSTMERLVQNEKRTLSYIPSLNWEGLKIIVGAPFKKTSMHPLLQTTTLIDTSNQLIRQNFKNLPDGVSTFVGLNFLRSLNLDHTALAEPIAFFEVAGQTSLIKTILPGKPIPEWMGEVGKLPASSPERLLGIRQLETMAFSAGRSTGELQKKGSCLPPLPDSQLKSAAQSVIYQVEQFVSNVSDQLEFIGKRFKTDPEKLIGPILKNFEQNPGPVSYGLGSNIQASELLWAGKPRTFGCLDTKGVLRGLDAKGAPLQFISEEQTFFHNLFLYEGVNAGLKISEIKRILKNYDKGYLAEYKGPAPSQAALQLYDLYGSILSLNESAAWFPAHNLRMVDLVEYQVKQIDKKLRVYSSQAANQNHLIAE